MAGTRLRSKLMHRRNGKASVKKEGTRLRSKLMHRRNGKASVKKQGERG